jgi:hypothetical protein
MIGIDLASFAFTLRNTASSSAGLETIFVVHVFGLGILPPFVLLNDDILPLLVV